jgi:peptide/nickel transport system permease protein
MSESTPASVTPDRAGRPYRPGQATGVLRSLSGVVGAVLTTLVFLTALVAGRLAPHDPFVPSGPSLSPPSAAHPMGTDALGRDLLSGVLFGARTSMFVAVGVGAIALVVGVTIGAVSGSAGGRTDDILMRLTEIVQVVPRFFLAILAIALFGTSQLVLISVFGFTSWVVLARVVRAEVLSLKEREFVQAARSQGASSLHILLREILPNALPVTIVYLALLLAHVILLEASLGFLGLGDPNTISWGYLAGQAQQFLRVAWWMSVFPGLAITLTVLGLNLLGDSLTDVLGHRR